eukprot:gene23249-30474_t
MAFTTAMHTYLHVASATDASVVGLKGPNQNPSSPPKPEPHTPSSGPSPMAFTTAMHTYLHVASATDASVVSIK